MSWVVRAPSQDLQRAEKKLFSRVRRVLWDYEPLRNILLEKKAQFAKAGKATELSIYFRDPNSAGEMRPVVPTTPVVPTQYRYVVMPMRI